MTKITLQSLNSKISGTINISGSKSISNRVLIMSALSNKEFEIHSLSNADDTERLKYYLKFIDTCRNSSIPMVINAENAGTVFRFLTAYLSIGSGRWLLTCNERMKKRPVRELVETLKSLGADISFAEEENQAPLKIVSKKLKGGEINIDPSRSSQFVSALMMIGPVLKYGLTINLEKKPVSEPYIQMTANLMKLFGADIKFSKNKIDIAHTCYKSGVYAVESDWSSASYWYEVVALNPGSRVCLPNFHKNSVQGDSALCDIFKNLGVDTFFEENGIILSHNKNYVDEFSFNANNCPDLVPSIMASCAAKGIKLSLSGSSHLKFKESDRISVMKKELAKIGCAFVNKGKTTILEPNINVDIADFETYGDHRIAMCLAPLCCLIDKLTISGPEVVEKSYPNFWTDMQKLNVFTIS